MTHPEFQFSNRLHFSQRSYSHGYMCAACATYGTSGRDHMDRYELKFALAIFKQY